MANKVKIEVTLEQANIISQCLDHSLRVSMGQLGSSYLPYPIQKLLQDKDNGESLPRKELWDSLALTLKEVLHPGLPRNASKSYSLNDFTKNCASLSKVINVELKRYDDQFELKPFWNVDSSFVDIYDVPRAKVEVMEEPFIIANRAICLDCDEIVMSKSRNDFVKCSCGSIAVDGGLDYIRRVGRRFTDENIYSDAPFETIRNYLYRNGTTLLKDMSNSWLENVIEYYKGKRNKFVKFYVKELQYRKENNIFVEEKNEKYN